MRFDVLTPGSWEEAIGLLAGFGEGAKILAGGTDLLVRIKQGMIKPAKVITLQRIANLDQIRYEAGQGLYLGPMVTHAEVARHPVVKARFTALAEASAVVGSPQVRNLGTVIGNIVNASPAADTAPALLVLQADLIVRDAAGFRSVPMSEFYRGPGRTVLRDGEIVEAVFIPEAAPGTVSTYLKLGRRQALEIAICGVAMKARPAGEVWEDVQIALGAVGPTPLQAVTAAKALLGGRWSKDPGGGRPPGGSRLRSD